MKRVLVLGGALLVGVACTGPQGAVGKPGSDGKDGTGTPSVSAVTPAYAYLGRTLDLTIAGNGTAWSSATQVAFADAKVKVNHVTAASTTGLLVNVTVGPDASVATTDVTVTDGSTTEVYKGAFQIRAPLFVSTDQKGTVPQGGFAYVHAQMLDITTPLDAATADVSLGVTDVIAFGAPNTTDYALDVLVGADVLAVAGEKVDLVVSSGPSGNTVDSPARAAFQVAARTPTTLTPTKGGSGEILTTSDSALYQFTPAGASTRFVQLNVASADMGGIACMVVPKSGKLADALSFFGVRYGAGVTGTDPTYLVATDSGSFFANSPPYGFTLAVVEATCTAVAEMSGSHDTSTLAQSLVALPALVKGDVNVGTVQQADWYKVLVTGASASSPRKIHAATGGDGQTDASLEIFDTDGSSSLGADAGDDYHKDVVSDAITTDGTYFVKVFEGTQFDATHSTYDLFVEVQ